MSVPGTEVRLPKPPGVIRRFMGTHPLAVDVFIAAWYIIGSCFGIFLDTAMATTDAFIAGPNSVGAAENVSTVLTLPGYLEWPWWPFAVLRIMLIATALLYRRKFPLSGLIVVAFATFGEHGVQSVASGVALCFMIYAVPVYRSMRAGWIGFAIAYAVALIQANLTVGLAPSAGFEAGLGVEPTTLSSNPAEFLMISIISGLWYVAILMLGINLGNRRRYLAAIIDRAHQLVLERDQRAKLAVAEERERISREMHDIVAHSLSVMIALSEGAARAAAQAPEAAADAMRKSAEAGRNALAETRRLLGALSDGDTDLAPQPALSDLPELAQGFRDAGLQVGLRIEGQPAGDRGQELAVYRAVQEALTNTLRYAGRGSRAEVTVRSDGHQTSVLVRDYGSSPGSTPAHTGLGAGKGLAGMSERARMLGGTATSGPAEAGPGWQLSVILPAGIGVSDPEQHSETEAT